VKYKVGDLIVRIDVAGDMEILEILRYQPSKPAHSRNWVHVINQEEIYDHFAQEYIEDPNEWRLATTAEKVLYGPKGHEDEENGPKSKRL